VHPIFANALRIGVTGEDVAAMTEWRLCRRGADVREGIDIAVRKGAHIVGTGRGRDEASELTGVVGFRVARILPTRGVHPVLLLAVGVTRTMLSVSGPITGTKYIPAEAFGVGQVAGALRFERELVLPTIIETRHRAVPTLRLAAIIDDDIPKDVLVEGGAWGIPVRSERFSRKSGRQFASARKSCPCTERGEL